MPEKVVLCWSGGKDSALALYQIKHDPGYQLVSLLSTVNQDYDRLSLHGVRRVLLERQVRALGYDLHQVFLSQDSSNEEYEERMRQALVGFKEAGVTGVVFGDIFLEDIRKYRENHLAPLGLKAIFPLWRKNTLELAGRFLHLGFKGVITCVDTQALDAGFAGRTYDEDFLADLPAKVDPCGENGEFHSFVYDGPIFHRPVSFSLGEKVVRHEHFCFCDLVPG